MLNSPKKYRGIKFLNVEQKFLNAKILNKKKAKKSISINTPILTSGTNEKSLKSSVIDYPYKTEEEKSPLVRNYSIKKSNKKLLSSKGTNSIKNKDSNIYKIVRKKSIEIKNVRGISPCKNVRINPRRVQSFKKNTSFKNMNLKSSLFINKNKIINSTNQLPNTNKDFNNYKNINDKSKKKNKSKTKKSINNNININKNDCVNIIKYQSTNLTKNEDSKNNKDENKMNKNIKKYFCCL